MDKLKYNPFKDSGITNYEQFSLYPFLVFGTLGTIKNSIQQQIKQIKDGYEFADRLIILGERGIGKTSTLFFIKEMLEKAGIQVKIFSRLIEDASHLMTLTTEIMGDPHSRTRIEMKHTLGEMTKKPIYFLIDFPDTVEAKTFKSFLNFLWSLMIHKNYNKINLVFTMNKSHYDKSFSYSETLGKFVTLRLEKLDYKETKELILSRLKIVEGDVNGYFSEEVLETVFNYSKGIPRNVISACGLLVDNPKGNKITKKIAEGILKEKYIDQVITDRVEDLELKRIYKQMTKILEEDFAGTSNSQEKYVKRVTEVCKIGRNSALERINELLKFGIFNQYKGGYNRVNKILSFN